VGPARGPEKNHAVNAAIVYQPIAALLTDLKERAMIPGATDDYESRAIENILTFQDLRATILHLMGLDHERLTFRHGCRDYRLTNVEGSVVNQLVA